MDESRFSVRPLTEGDYGSWAAIEQAIRPDQPVSAETLRHQEEAFGPSNYHELYNVDARQLTRAVAVGGVGQAPEAARGNFWLDVAVHPEVQRQGIGARLYETLLARAEEKGAQLLRAFVREEERAGRAFLVKRGFVERRRNWTSLLDLASVDLERLPTRSREPNTSRIEISTLAREGVHDPRVLEQLYRLDAEASVDEPRLEPYVPPSFANYRTFNFGGPNALPEAWFIAKDRGQYVAFSYAQRESAAPDTLEQMFTCTQREYRRQGLALALKLRIIDYGKRHGYRWIRTHNDSSNVPMWALNERLGFRKVYAGIQTEKVLARPDSR
ncbi:MAG: GNAT family N-acetyltransferase [Thermoplasmata archaeon]|nr:GNAT family N-acetyltransferase [Thermoplasmata archaeon]